MIPDAVRHLRLYNQKATELNESSFAKQVRERRPVFQLLPGPFRALREGGPDPEATKAFVLTFRLFLRGPDGLSFREIESYYDQWPLSERLRQEIRTIRADVNRFLDGPTPLEVFGDRISRGRLLDTWLFGELAHLNHDKRAQLENWHVEDDVKALFEHEFENVMIRVLQAVFWVRQVNLEALAELANSAAETPSVAP